MTIFYTVLKSRFSDRDLKIIYETFSDDFISRVQKSKVNIYIDKRFTLMLLIIEICKKMNIPTSYLIFLKHNENGKAIMPNLNIAISYTKNFIFCAISHMRIGFDVEYIDKNIPRENLAILNTCIGSSLRNYENFYLEWTRLESIIKYYDDLSLLKILFDKININDFKLDTIYLKTRQRCLIAISGENIAPFEKTINIKYQKI